jgi:PIN domain nuclease of toxin-antitoxin system
VERRDISIAEENSIPMIVLDTHVLVWLLGDPDRLSAKARQAIHGERLQGATPAISGQSLYELARAVVRGRMRTHSPLSTFMERIETNFNVLPLTAQIGRIAAEFPSTFPSDPFDRIIAATALAHGAPLITADGNILRSGEVKTIW